MNYHYVTWRVGCSLVWHKREASDNGMDAAVISFWYTRHHDQKVLYETHSCLRRQV